jgi:hypothetical protein
MMPISFPAQTYRLDPTARYVYIYIYICGYVSVHMNIPVYIDMFVFI